MVLLMLAPKSLAPVKFARFKIASLKLALSKFAYIISAPLRSALTRLASFKNAPINLALVKLAFVRLAPINLVPVKLNSDKSIWLKFLPLKSKLSLLPALLSNLSTSLLVKGSSVRFNSLVVMPILSLLYWTTLGSMNSTHFKMYETDIKIIYYELLYFNLL